MSVNFKCDHCKKEQSFGDGRQLAIREAQDAGWKILAGVCQVCPDCADCAESDNDTAGAGAKKKDPSSFQQRVDLWMLECFGAEISSDRDERCFRFLEESLELVQAAGCSKEDAHDLVDYVFGRSIGELHQETGGVMVTLAALCNTFKINMSDAAVTELERCWQMIPLIRQKQASKPQRSPLPQKACAVCSIPIQSYDDEISGVFNARQRFFCSKDHLDQFASDGWTQTGDTIWHKMTSVPVREELCSCIHLGCADFDFAFLMLTGHHPSCFIWQDAQDIWSIVDKKDFGFNLEKMAQQICERKGWRDPQQLAATLIQQGWQAPLTRKEKQQQEIIRDIERRIIKMVLDFQAANSHIKSPLNQLAVSLRMAQMSEDEIMAASVCKREPEQTGEPCSKLTEAVRTLSEHLQEDPDLFYGWQSNLAMTVADEISTAQAAQEPLSSSEIYAVGNQAAKKFLENLINIPDGAWCALPDPDFRNIPAEEIEVDPELFADAEEITARGYDKTAADHYPLPLDSDQEFAQIRDRLANFEKYIHTNACADECGWFAFFTPSGSINDLPDWRSTGCQTEEQAIRELVQRATNHLEALPQAEDELAAAKRVLLDFIDAFPATVNPRQTAIKSNAMKALGWTETMTGFIDPRNNKQEKTND